jgi:ATP-dependent Clp protease ATP-binding subunit ClpA
VFERFTQESRAIVVGAQEHARRLHHGYVGCEHLLLALANTTNPTSALFAEAGATPARIEAALVALLGPASALSDDKSALAALGIDLDEVRKAVEANFGPGSLDEALPSRRRRWRGGRWRRSRRTCSPLCGHLPFTPRAKRCLELSLREALQLKHGYIGVEHIALGLLRCDDTMAWRVLRHLGVEPTDLRHVLVQSLRRSA